MARPPLLLISSVRRRNASSFRAISISWAPCSAAMRAVVNPIPLVAPVTTITCSSILLSFIYFLSPLLDLFAQSLGHACRSMILIKRRDAGFSDFNVLRNGPARDSDRPDDSRSDLQRNTAA